MLVGPSTQPSLPPVPHEKSSLDDIRRYLRELTDAISIYAASITINTIGLLNTRGLSSTGTRAENFTMKSLLIGNTTSATWGFSNIESNVSYVILFSPNKTTGMVMTGQTRNTTGVVFNFSPVVPSGTLLDICLLR